MVNKRGDIFALWLVMITLFMCGIAITSYVFQQDSLDASLVSSMDLLRFEDRVDIYEFNEIIELKKYFCDVNLDARTAEGLFVNEMEKYSSLFFEDGLYYNGQKVESVSVDSLSERILFLYKVYDISSSSGVLTVIRSGAVHKFEVSSEDRSSVNFVIGVEVGLDKKYVLDSSFCGN